MIEALAAGAVFAPFAIGLDRILSRLLHRIELKRTLIQVGHVMSLLSDLHQLAKDTLAKAENDVAAHVQSLKDIAAKAEADGAALLESHRTVVAQIEAALAKVPTFDDLRSLIDSMASAQAHTS